MRSLPGHPAVTELPSSVARRLGGHVFLLVPQLMGAARGAGGDRGSKGGCWGRGAPTAWGAGAGTIPPCSAAGVAEAVAVLPAAGGRRWGCAAVKGFLFAISCCYKSSQAA